MYVCARRYVPAQSVKEHSFSQIASYQSPFTGCSRAILCNPGGGRSQIPTLAHCLPVRFSTNLWDTVQVTENQGSPSTRPEFNKRAPGITSPRSACDVFSVSECIVHGALLSLLALRQNDGAPVFLDLGLSFVFFYGVFSLLHKMICLW